MTTRHRKNKSRRKSAALALPVAAALLAGGVMDHQPARHETSAVVQAQSSHRVVNTDAVDLLALALFGVPGATYDSRQPLNYAWQDNGIWEQFADSTVLGDKDRYSGQISQASLEGGASWLLEELLKRDPNTTTSVINAGSFGGYVTAEALNRLAATGYDMSSVFGVFYNDANTPGTGVFSRFGRGQSVLGSDLGGGSIPLPEGGTYLRLNREYDPIAYFPKYLLNPISWAVIVVHYAIEHAQIGIIDHNDPENEVTVDGNVTTVKLNTPVMPMLLPLKLLGVPTAVIKVFQEVLEPIVATTGMHEEGRAQLLPSPEMMVRHAAAIAEGFARAGERLTALLTGKPYKDETPPPVETSNPTTTPELIDAAEERDQELSGGLSERSNEPQSLRIAFDVGNTESDEPQSRDIEAPIQVAENTDSTVEEKDEVDDQSTNATEVSDETESTETEQPQAEKPQAENDEDGEVKKRKTPRTARTASAPSPKKDEQKNSDDSSESSASSSSGSDTKSDSSE